MYKMMEEELGGQDAFLENSFKNLSAALADDELNTEWMCK